jgi:hypothetical protein
MKLTIYSLGHLDSETPLKGPAIDNKDRNAG